MKHIHPQLLELQNKFKTFRAENHRRTRIPDSLRQEVLQALDAGISRAEIVKTLKIGSSQIFHWQNYVSAKSVHENTSVMPRILNVTPEPLPSGLRVTYEGGKWLLEISF